MHRALRILEIIELICLDVRRRPTYASLARTCRDFQDPALNLLWRDQDTLTHLLQCLPSALWETIVEESATHRGRFIQTFASRLILFASVTARILTSSQKITGKVQPKDWDRPLEYARRIRSLELYHYRGEGPGLPSADVFETISSTFPLSQLCPNLRYLEWRSPSEELFPYLCLLAGPKLTGAHLIVPRGNFSDISNSSLQLVRHTLSTIAMSFDRIEHLALNAINGAIFHRLAHLPALRSLDLTKWSWYQDTLDLSSFSDYPFLPLRTLKFRDTTIDFCTKFFTAISNCSLNSVYVETKTAASTNAMQAFYTALANHLSYTTLQELEIGEDEFHHGGMDSPDESAIADYVISGRVLSTLFCFGDLQRVSLRGPVGFDVDDAIIWDMARSWPKITSLALETATELNHPPSMTLGGLRAFATHCPDLNYLSITFNTSTVPPFDNSPETRLSQRALTCLGVGVAPISDSGDIARFLSALFPNIVHIRTVIEWRQEADEEEDPEEFTQHTVWKQVEELIPMLNDVRREARRWEREGRA
ncbi:hypothetical protein C8R43DRAFT_1165272 [Mycena crocata]|nr:hypothetical protein C8R43DRAFT_1165272 [Mycena crocata]